MIQFYQSFSLFTNQILTELSSFLPRLTAALLILVIGTAIAKTLKGLTIKLLEALKISNWVKNTPVEHFVKHAQLGEKIESMIGSIVYWLLMLVVLHSTVSVLGLASLSIVLDRVIAYIPRVMSAILVLFFGVLVAGVIEGLVKGSIMSISGRNARLLGKVASYLVLTIAILAAVNELRIASEFIMVMFVGFIAMLALGFGLAIGLGGQSVVKEILTKWYQQTAKEISKK